MQKKKDTVPELTENSNPKTVKVWKTSITKTELAELPAECISGKITVVDDESGISRAVRILSESNILGFDTETKPSFKRGEHHSVALLQLSTPCENFLIRLNKIGLPKALSNILEDPNILKIGLSVHDDFMSLKRKYKIEPQNFIDLQQYVKNFNIADNSLSRIYGILFDKRISKGQRLTNWEAENLSQNQMEYAALDAEACLKIYSHLKDNGFNYNTSKYYREFDEPSN